MLRDCVDRDSALPEFCLLAQRLVADHVGI